MCDYIKWHDLLSVSRYLLINIDIFTTTPHLASTDLENLAVISVLSEMLEDTVYMAHYTTPSDYALTCD